MRQKCIDYNGGEHYVEKEKLIHRLSVYGIYLVDGKLLFICDPRSGRYELPGGGVDISETEILALRREFIEEVGSEINELGNVINEWTEFYFDLPTNQGWQSLRKFYLIKSIKGEPSKIGNGDDSAGAVFIDLQNIERYRNQIQAKIFEMLTKNKIF